MALGNDGVNGTDDDYGVQLPGNLDGVTVKADPGDNVKIHGPGDLTSSSIEAGFLVYNNGVGHTTNTDWTFRDFTIEGIDNAIGFYYTNNDFSGLTIDHMHIVVPADNTTEPNDFQNIGIFYSFGQNISITNNTIDFEGTGDGSSIGIQSTTHGGTSYDNLDISGNTFTVLGNGTEDITGVWENGHSHLSDISVSGNFFYGLATHAGDQTGFLVTSHSGATSTVSYANNTISNADVGIDWLDEYGGDPVDYTGTLPVIVSGNIMTDMGTGVRVGGINASATLSNNSITGNSGVGVDVLAGASVTIGSGSFQHLDVGIRVAGSAAISGVNFNSGVDNDIDIQLLAGVGTVSLGAGNLFGGDTYFIDNQSNLSFDLTSYTATNFEGLNPATLSDDYRIEDKMHHRLDTDLLATVGLITWVAGNVYVTDGGTDHSIQRGIQAASVNDTVNVEAGTYGESVDLNKKVTLLGAGSGPLGTVIQPTGTWGINFQASGASD